MRVVREAGPPPERPEEPPDGIRFLDAWHACDHCGARSFEVWRHERTWHLFTFCAHDGREAQVRLHALGYRLFMTARAY